MRRLVTLVVAIATLFASSVVPAFAANVAPTVPVNVSVSACIESCQPVAVSTLTPTFTGTSTDADSGTLQYVVEVRVNGTSTVIATATGSPTAQGTPGSVTLPAGVLTDGVVYQYRLNVTDGLRTSLGSYKTFQPKVAATTPTHVYATPGLAGDVAWGLGGSPYLLENTIALGAGTTLRIAPGTVVKEHGGRLSVVGGQLISKGTAAAPIYFTSYEDDSVGGDTGGDGPTQGAAGNYSSILSFGGTADQMSEAKTSIITNTSVRYGGSTSPARCETSSMVNIEGEARVSIDHSEFTDSLAAAISMDSTDLGIGSTSIKHSLFDRLGTCGIDTSGGRGVIEANYFADPNHWSIWTIGNPGDGVKVIDNWMNGPIYHFTNLQPAITREDIDYQGNAFLGNWDNGTGSYLDPEDLSGNYWPVLAPLTCLPTNSTAGYMPPVDKRVNTSCPSNYEAYKYFTRVLPLSPPPPVVPVGLQGSPVLPGTVLPGQLLGNGGSEFAINPSGYQSDPVNTATGSYTEHAVDASLPVLGGDLTLDRTYNSADETSGPFGHGWSTGLAPTLTFPVSGTVVLTGSDGQQASFVWDAITSAYVPAPGVTAQLATAPGGFVVTTKDRLTYEFDEDGDVHQVTDANGNEIDFDYNDGHLATVSSGSRSLAVTWADGRITQVELPDGRTVEYGYDNDRLASVTDLAGNTTTYGYDAHDRLSSKTDPLGHVQMALDYDTPTGRVSQQTDARGKVSTFDWNPTTGTATLTDPRGGTWRDVYTGNLLTKRVDPLGQSTTYDYDAHLRLVATEDPRGFRSTFVWDPEDQLLSSSTPTGIVTNAYDNAGNLIRVRDPKGLTTTQEFDAHHNLTRIEQAGRTADTARVTTFEYDNAGFLTSTEAPSGRTTDRTRNAHGDLLTVTRDSATTAMTYDTVGRLHSTTSPRGTVTTAPDDYTTTYTYDDADRLTETQDPLGRTSTSTFDDAGRLVTTEDPSGRVTSYTYRNDNKLSALQGPNLSIPPTTYDYDNNGNLTTVTDPSGRTDSNTYDAANQLSTKAGPEGTFSYTRNANGDIATETRPGNKVITYKYTAAGKIRSVTYPTGTTAVTYAYDANGNRTGMTQGSRSTTYAYNGFNELLTATTGTQVFTYTYDPDGRVATMKTPTAATTGYDYTVDGLLNHVTRNGVLQATYAYDADGNPETVSLADGSTRELDHDQAGRTTHINDTAPGSRTILDDHVSYDDNDNPTLIEHADNTTDTYTYNNLDQLTAVCYATTDCTSAIDYVRWTYDPVGNRTSEQRPAGTTTYNRDAATGRLTTTTAPGGATTTFTYDPQGRLASDGTNAYTYDSAGRLLTEQATGQPVTTYTYDGDGQRIKAVAGTTTTNYLWDPATYQLAATTDQAGATLRDLTYGLGPITETNATATSYLHADLQNSVIEATTPTGDSRAHYTYEPYGNLKATTPGTAGGPEPSLRWAGQVQDPSGDYHLRARQYAPELGSFVTPDPASAQYGSATYTYGVANPMVNADPLGLASTDGGSIWDNVKYAAQNIIGLTPAGPALQAFRACEGPAKGSCGTDVVAMGIASVVGLRGLGSFGRAATSESEMVQRWMSEAELSATIDTGLVRGGREGTHYVTDFANHNALRARQRLALPQTPQVRVQLEVPKGAFSVPKSVRPDYNMPGGGLERTASGPVQCRVVCVWD